MSDQAATFAESLEKVTDQLDEMESVKAHDNSSAVITFADGSTHRLGSADCRKVFHNHDTVKQFLKAIPGGLEETSLELYDLTLPEEVLFELEEKLAVVEEV